MGQNLLKGVEVNVKLTAGLPFGKPTDQYRPADLCPVFHVRVHSGCSCQVDAKWESSSQNTRSNRIRAKALHFCAARRALYFSSAVYTGFRTEALAVNAIRTKKVWPEYAVNLTQCVQKAARDLGLMETLNILLFRNSIEVNAAMLREITRDPDGIVWKKSAKKSAKKSTQGARRRNNLPARQMACR